MSVLIKKIAAVFLILSLNCFLTGRFSAFVFGQNPPYFGVNFWALSKGSPEQIRQILDYLQQTLRISGTQQLIRLWGYQETLGIDGYNNLERVLNNAAAGQKFIVSLEDFPHGPAVANPKEWFESGYLEEYRPYVAMMVEKYKGSGKIDTWEIMNEPHCKNDPSCSEAFLNFMNDISSLIHQIDPSAKVSSGAMPWDQPALRATYLQVMKLPHIDVIDCHYYNDQQKADCMAALQAAKSAGKIFYLGEAGYLGKTNANCTNGASAEERQNRASQVQTDAGRFLHSGASAFLLWQFSPTGSSLFDCDPYSFFPDDPVFNLQGLPAEPLPSIPPFPESGPLPSLAPITPGPAFYPANSCLAGTGKPPAGELRPQPCADCNLKVRKAVDSCLDTATIKTTGKYKLDALKICANDADRYALWNWRAEFNLNTEKTKVPFAGYREILPGLENQQKYLADYFEGTALYDGQPAKGPSDTNFILRQGLWRRLAPQGLQDEYKIKLIRRGFNYVVKDNRGRSLNMQAWGREPYPQGHLPPDRQNPNYAELYAQWQKTIYGQLWPYVPMFSREDAAGKIIAEIEHPPGELRLTNPEAKQISPTKVEFPVSFPHLTRLYEVTKAVQKLFLPQAPKNQNLNASADPKMKTTTKTSQVLAATTASSCYGVRLSLESKNDAFSLHAWDTNPESCGATLVDPTISVTWVKNGLTIGSCTLTASPNFRGFPRDDGKPNNYGTPITDLQGCAAPLSPKDLKAGDRLEVTLTVLNAGGANDPNRGCFQTANCTCTLKINNDGSAVQNCAGAVVPPPPEIKTCQPATFSPDICLEDALKDPNEKLDAACCSDTATAVVNDYWRFVKRGEAWCDALKDKCCRDQDPAARDLCRANICSNPDSGDCPWESTTLSRKIRFEVKIPYLKVIWNQIGNLATKTEEVAKDNGLFNLFKPSQLPKFQAKAARSEIEFTANSAQVEGQTPHYAQETKETEISPQKADLYFPYLGGAELVKQWVINSLRPDKKQENREKPF